TGLRSGITGADFEEAVRQFLASSVVEEDDGNNGNSGKKDKKDKKDKKRRIKGDSDDAEGNPDDDDADDGKKEKRKPYKHRGTILEGKIGVLGCMRRHCKDEANHNSKPGLALGGYFGRNILGLIDVGLEGAWGRVQPQAYSGRNALDLYGLDPNALTAVIAEEMGVPASMIPVDFNGLTVGDIKSTAVHVGPTLRIHIIPRGRLSAYVGGGVHYQLWRNHYETLGGDFRLSFHGVSLPLSAGVGYYVLRWLNLNAEFTYDHVFWLASGIRHPDLDFVAPILLINDAAIQAGSDLKKDLPTFWSLVLSARFRF
ncbi:MAG: hypothetical protein KC486_32575, partial [Myxococcales bacterium]|nr:hypothetical protein [Myxococcales bacterium]